MLINLLLGLATMTVCLLLQGVLVVAALRFFSHRQDIAHSAFIGGMRVTAGMMCILIAGNIAQVAAWAMLFYMLGEFDTLSTAVYHSAVNFATLGYGDIVMSPEHRLLGPLEAMNGVLMIGVSTAALTRAFHEVIRDHHPR
ncbi:potassium channel family protein [Parahaliea mediterranea]|uniref:Two pore domain potassium channel family protein n=1 Tax=Parahaliea mediterranea TaxID=651086 RepID=A0A939IIK5_9GAMM|nr:potassium channel family protein [Parahaliea mediterranea]MBN7796709.1 two pore domain potassium channel family protein [Parahaliea mediterranea]